MADTCVQGTVPLAIEAAFDVYVNQINRWWPRQGVFPFSFAPKTTLPRHIRFDIGENGRFYETFVDDSEYTIGEIVAWQPPTLLSYTWRDPTWRGSTTIRVTFAASDGGTTVVYEQDGFAVASVGELAPFYQIGNRQTLAGYFAHCQAIFELQEAGLSFG